MLQPIHREASCETGCEVEIPVLVKHHQQAVNAAVSVSFLWDIRPEFSGVGAGLSAMIKAVHALPVITAGKVTMSPVNLMTPMPTEDWSVENFRSDSFMTNVERCLLNYCFQGRDDGKTFISVKGIPYPVAVRDAANEN